MCWLVHSVAAHTEGVKVFQSDYDVQCFQVTAANLLPVPNKQKSAENFWSILISSNDGELEKVWKQVAIV
jgi:hypothetical protein